MALCEVVRSIIKNSSSTDAKEPSSFFKKEFALLEKSQVDDSTQNQQKCYSTSYNSKVNNASRPPFDFRNHGSENKNRGYGQVSSSTEIATSEVAHES
jgi:hypothetical protein